MDQHQQIRRARRDAEARRYDMSGEALTYDEANAPTYRESEDGHLYALSCDNPGVCPGHHGAVLAPGKPWERMVWCEASERGYFR
jgi:hypothetical protein